VTLESVLSHTSGCIEFMPPYAATLEQMIDTRTMAAAIGRTPRPLVQPGSLQFYHHLTYGWLLARACELAGTDVTRAWAEMAAAACGGEPTKLSLTRPADGRACAEPFKAIAGPSIADFGLDLEELGAFVDACDRIEAADATPAQRAHGAAWKSLFGHLHWVDAPSFRREVVKRAAMPGMAAWANARDASEALRSLIGGAVISNASLADARTSRRPDGQSEHAVHTRLPRSFKVFEGAEWGLGVQLVALEGGGAGQPHAFGHVAANGSFCLCLPAGPAVGPRPLIATLLTNCSDLRRHSDVANRLLDALLAASRAAAGD